MRIGSGYKGSPNLQTSVSNQEIIPDKPADWTMGYMFYRFSFYNDQECHILINNDTEAKYLRAGQGFESTSEDTPIFSFKIIENSITYNWFGAF